MAQSDKKGKRLYKGNSTHGDEKGDARDANECENVQHGDEYENDPVQH